MRPGRLRGGECIRRRGGGGGGGTDVTWTIRRFSWCWVVWSCRRCAASGPDWLIRGECAPRWTEQSSATTGRSPYPHLQDGRHASFKREHSLFSELTHCIIWLNDICFLVTDNKRWQNAVGLILLMLWVMHDELAIWLIKLVPVWSKRYSTTTKFLRCENDLFF